MGSKTVKKIAVPLVALALGAAPAGASAAWRVDYSQNGATGEYQPQVVHKDYSKNGATGDFTPASNIRSTPPVTPATPQASGDSFAWGAAAVGAGSTLLVVLLVGVTTMRVRRRITPAGPTRPSAA
jgi:hypothetical protein